MREILLTFLDVLYGLIGNAVLLFALAFIYGATNYTGKSKNIWKQIFLGFFIGLISILIMLQPWYQESGIFYDTRDILFSVAAYTFGPVSVGIAAVIGIAFRIGVGGSGVVPGILTILFSVFIGMSWKYYITPKIKHLNKFTQYYLLGLTVNLAVVLIQFTIPNGQGWEYVKLIALPFLVFFPIFQAILMIALSNQSYRIHMTDELLKQKILLQSSIDSSRSMEIFSLNKEFEYISYNTYHKESMFIYYGEKIDLGMNYLFIIKDTSMRARIHADLVMALSGKATRRTIEVEDHKGKFLEEHYTPIKDVNGNIVGITVFSQEITDRKNYEESILYLSYHDALTGLYNRRFYQEELVRLDQEMHYPLSIIMADINGLKIMNDAFGHESGDELLKTVARELNSVFYGFGNVARIGGDEFVVLLRKCTTEKASMLIDELLKNTSKLMIHGMEVSVSLGNATKENNEIDIDELIKYAEDDMYKHKLIENTKNRNESIRRILDTLTSSSEMEYHHSVRVSQYAGIIGELLHMSKEEIAQLQVLGKIHDIGKIAIDSSIINKSSSLTLEEYASVKRHSEIGYRLLSSLKEFKDIAEDVLSHHERYDGLGYPQGLAKEDIPIKARIVCVADAYESMTSDRPYRKARSVEEALIELERCSGTQFDPRIVKVFVDAMRTKNAK